MESNLALRHFSSRLPHLHSRSTPLLTPLSMELKLWEETTLIFQLLLPLLQVWWCQLSEILTPSSSMNWNRKWVSSPRKEKKERSQLKICKVELSPSLNGGTFGSLMGTPILNPPQSAILGMHSIIERPVVRNGVVVPRPMMYLALTYDHTLLDGKDAVLFLKRIQRHIEDPRRKLLEIWFILLFRCVS